MRPADALNISARLFGFTKDLNDLLLAKFALTHGVSQGLGSIISRDPNFGEQATSPGQSEHQWPWIFQDLAIS
jgi:hypothetical protein